MQPHTIKKNRVISPIGLMMGALAVSTILICGWKLSYVPYFHNRRRRDAEEFAIEFQRLQEKKDPEALE